MVYERTLFKSGSAHNQEKEIVNILYSKESNCPAFYNINGKWDVITPTGVVEWLEENKNDQIFNEISKSITTSNPPCDVTHPYGNLGE